MALNIVPTATVSVSRLVLILGVMAMGCSCDSVAEGGQKMAATNTYQWKDLWRGSGPPKSPTGAPPGLTVVQSRAAWARIITAFGPPNDRHVDLPVDWEKECILFVQGPEDNPDTKVYLKSMSSDGKTITIAAELRDEPDAGISYEVVVRPWVIASAPAAPFSRETAVHFSIDGRAYPVAVEK